MKSEMESELDKLMDLFYRPIGDIIPSSKRVWMIELIFSVPMAEIEMHESERILRGIILSRISQTCPQCNGSGQEPSKTEAFCFCTLCKGSGRVSSVAREKFLLSRLNSSVRIGVLRFSKA